MGPHGSLYGFKLEDTTAGKSILALDRTQQARMVALARERVTGLDRQVDEMREKNPLAPHRVSGWKDAWGQRGLCCLVLQALLRRKLPLSSQDALSLLGWLLEDQDRVSSYGFPLLGIVSAVVNVCETEAPSPELRQSINQAITSLRGHFEEADCRKAADRLAGLIQDGPSVEIEPGEAWSDVALADLAALDAQARPRWNALLGFAQQVAAKPTGRWFKEAQPLLDAVGIAQFKAAMLRWFPLVDRPRTRPIERANPWDPDWDHLLKPQHVDLLKSLVWLCASVPDAELARALTSLAVSAYRKIPGKGPRLVVLGNACVTALGMMPGMAALGAIALLKVKVKFGTAQKEIDKALTAAAAREGLPREEIEELGVPAYGLEEVGRRREVFGAYVAEVLVDGEDAEIHWSKVDGGALKSVPAAVKKDHAEDWKELQNSTKDISRMLTAQRERIDSLFLARKTWPFPVWRERYFDHPLVGTIARRLIWTFTQGTHSRSGCGPEGVLMGRDDQPLEGLGPETTVVLWHPIDHSIDEVLAWRTWLETKAARQPFKQAHREVYLLTDAERRTHVYSNRFASHILRQHQYHALCAARGWRNKLRLMVDDTYPPTSRELPEWGLRAEYWVEGTGDEYGRDTNDSGAYLYLTTDQVRFYPIAAVQRSAHASGGGYRADSAEADAGGEPVALDQIPPLVFSEIMRDVDLFVGVASVGNDPTWNDGGPEGRYVDYWRQVSFGDLSATGETRKVVLERLIPRLKIADRCSFHDRFLVVRGDLRTYKIHLGSGNILMEPNDEYLCIVPKGSGAAPSEKLFLPFEGDRTLSIVLSKALLLADDRKITDTTITNQILSKR